MKQLILGALAACLAVSLVGQSEMASKLQSRLDKEQAALDETLLRIDSEKRVLLHQLEQAESGLKQADRLWTLTTAREEALGSPSLLEPLQEKVGSTYKILGQIRQFNEDLTERMHPAEAKTAAERRGGFVPVLTPGDAVIASDDALQSQIQLMEEAVARLEHMAGGYTFDATVLDSNRGSSAGQIWLLGPVAFFQPEDGGKMAWISHSSGNIPSIADALPPIQDGLRAAFSGAAGSVALPVDPNRPYQPKTGLSGKLAEIEKGGIWIIPILGFALLATLSALMKWIQLRRYKAPSEARVQRYMLEVETAANPDGPQLAENWRRPIGKLIEKALRLRAAGDPKMEAKLTREVYLLHPELTQYLAFIAITASVSPLLGLLGTVSGMIETFDVISVHGTRNAQMLSGGISEALITTEFGLIVAIPALVLHSLLNRKVRRLMSQLEQLVRSIAALPPAKGGSE